MAAQPTTPLSGYKTYITALVGALSQLGNAFHIPFLQLKPDQWAAVTSILAFLALIFLRMGVKKAQDAATQAAK